MFSGCSNLESVAFAEESILTSIGSEAFRYCSSLTSIDIPAEVTSIGSEAFRYCSNLTSIEIPAGVTSIGEHAFDGCSNLTGVSFAEGSQLTSIGSYAFYGCSSLKSIEIPAGVTSIGDYAFRYCSNLTSIEIPAGVTSIGSCAFEFCSNLESVTFAEGSQLASIGRYAFRDCSSLKSIEILAGVTSIGDSAFWCCSNLNTVYYAGSIENWFNIDFEDSCSNPLSYGADLYIDGALLTKVEVPESITTIGYQLAGCTSLTSITIHSGVTSIGGSAFSGCSNLESVTFAEGSLLTSIGDYAFYECSNLNKVYYAGSIEDWFNIEFGGSYTNPLYYGADLYIGGELVTEVVVPESVTTIEEQLRGCTSLTSITIHFGVTSIGSSAFSGCSNLESVSFAEGSQLTSIGDYAFFGCSSLTSIEIPAGVTSIGNSAFWGCYLTIVYNYSDLEITAGSSDYGDVAYYAEVVLTDDNLTNVKDENGYVTYTDGEEVLLLGYLGSEKDIVIPEGVTRIAKYAFYWDDIVSVTLPESLTEIGNSAFDGCYNLKEIYNNSALDITVGSTDLGRVAYYAVKVHNSSESESIFDDESGFAIVDGVLYGYRGSATNIIIPETVTSIARYAFYGNTDIISVTIPAGVTSIGDYAFNGCSSLTGVGFADGSQLTSIGSSAFSGCSSLTSIEITAGVTSIGGWAFHACSNLESVTFAEGRQLTSIGYGAFEDCSNLDTVYYAGSIENWFAIEFEYYSNPLSNGADLYIGGELVTEVVVPESVTAIGNCQFASCTSLTSITIHSGVTTIGSSAFSGCSNLESVTFAEGSGLTSIGSGAFRGCSSLTSIEIPAGVTHKYRRLCVLLMQQA